MATRLSVNLNKVALLRNSRHLDMPSVVEAGRVCLEAGAGGLTVHPRPDERHIRGSDVMPIAALVEEFRAKGTDIEYNIEGNPDARFLEIVMEARPDQVTLVPDDPNQFTSDHGWEIGPNLDFLKGVVSKLKEAGMRVAIFLDAEDDLANLERVPETGADRIELYTEPYAAAFGGEDQETTLWRFGATGKRAVELGIGLNAGHDLNQENLPMFLHEMPHILEVSIGHALTSEALLGPGLEQTVKNYINILGA